VVSGYNAPYPTVQSLLGDKGILMDNFQRINSISNAHIGRAFEEEARKYFISQGLTLEANHSIPIGVESLKKEHAFDLGSNSKKIIVECKSHKWTTGDNVPSAKLTVWNEAMYYFQLAPKDYRKIFFVLRDYSAKRKETLAEYYVRNYGHLIPSGVEILEYDETLSECKVVNKGTASRAPTL
jgi:hypothetical protein